MKFVKLVSAYYLDPAVSELGGTTAALGDAAEVAFTRGMGYCGAAETGGFIPASQLPSLIRRYTPARGRRIAAELVLADLWQEVKGGYQIRTWVKNQDELEKLLQRRKSDSDRQRRRRASQDSSRDEEPDASRDVSRDMSRDASRNSLLRARGRERRREVELEEQDQNPVVALVCRRLFGNARATTTTGLVELWQEAAGRADLDAELKAWLVHNAGTDLRDPSAALLGWLRTAAKRAGTPALGCTDCIGGWTPDEFGQPSEHRCTACRPHLRAVDAS